MDGIKRVLCLYDGVVNVKNRFLDYWRTSKILPQHAHD